MVNILVEISSILSFLLVGTFEVTHAAWPVMQRQNYGRIINIGSGAGLYGNFGQANYSSAKMAIVGLTNTLAKEGEKHNIHVNCVVPIAGSRMTATVIPESMLALLDPAHVAPLVTFLAHESSGINGEIFEVGGGWYSRVRWQRSQGVTLGGQQNPATPEDIMRSMAVISDFSNPSYPTSASDAFGLIISAATSGPASSPPETAAVKENPVVAAAAASRDDSASSQLKLKTDSIFEGLARLVQQNPSR